MRGKSDALEITIAWDGTNVSQCLTLAKPRRRGIVQYWIILNLSAWMKTRVQKVALSL